MHSTAHLEMHVLDRARYRVRQFMRGIKARVGPAERAEVRRILPSAASLLFDRMPVDAQRHSLNVLALLRASGPVGPDLAVAALLHDCGKLVESRNGAAISLWKRGPLVLLDAAAPGITTRWSSADPFSGWRYMLYVHRQHPALGAELAGEAGCTEAACWLIAHHQDRMASGDTGQIDALQRLQWADNRT
jgi:hypothetical protein